MTNETIRNLYTDESVLNTLTRYTDYTVFTEFIVSHF